MEREHGTETTPCPNCGTDLATVENLDGSTSPVNCDTCWPSEPTDTEKAAEAESVPREHGVVEVNDDDDE